jgi:predicted small integral membrane protein
LYSSVLALFLNPAKNRLYFSTTHPKESNTMTRIVKIGLVVAVVLWGLLGALGNVLHWDETVGSVAAVTSMVTFEGGAESWQATSNPLVIWLGALFIMLSKLSAGILCAVGAGRMWRSRKGDAADFSAAKRIALAGCGIAVIMLFGGFIVIAESWFELWRSETLGAAVLPAAVRYASMIALIAIFVAMPDD